MRKKPTKKDTSNIRLVKRGRASRSQANRLIKKARLIEQKQGLRLNES